MQFNIIQIIITALFFGVFCGYLTQTAGPRTRKRLIIKMCLCALYLAFAVVNLVTVGNYTFLPIAIIVVLCLNATGDYCLARKGKKTFAVGAVLFLCGNLSLFIIQLANYNKLGIPFSDYWWFLLVFALFVGAFVFAVVKKVLSFGKVLPLLSIYIVMVSLSGSLGITLIALSTSQSMTFLGIGTLLFMISDFCLGFARFSQKRSVVAQILNSITYFWGMYFLALSILGGL